ncbi:TetR/AcrR family transcriptional regulator [Niallia circulans]|uniref:TetR/AcrR family transcriptional regulator C-terminal domain-containing protein n=1 Tax=Niallia circulans TaxID=1397 RepID=A0A941GDP0_NIACI|nr:TetR/AcrR family transcriptional regulator C-terminal domain-containing protein [Niallia circulans]MCB5236936.1 TetR/AcrR family transcriptional regulator C-terminal domain-containing protein [Niallia circulans]
MQNKSKLDPRIRRTRRFIREAFISLLEEKDFNKISIHELTKRADINRVTFYLHYKDINDMVESIFDELLSDIESILSNQGNNVDELKSLVLLLEHIADNAHLYKLLLVSKNIQFFTPRLMELLHRLILNNTEEITVKKAESVPAMNIPRDIAAWYGTSAIVGTISLWLGNDMPYSPKFLAEQMVMLNPLQSSRKNITY